MYIEVTTNNIACALQTLEEIMRASSEAHMLHTTWGTVQLSEYEKIEIRDEIARHRAILAKKIGIIDQEKLSNTGFIQEAHRIIGINTTDGLQTLAELMMAPLHACLLHKARRGKMLPPAQVGKIQQEIRKYRAILGAKIKIPGHEILSNADFMAEARRRTRTKCAIPLAKIWRRHMRVRAH